jgi:hypothetical protein
LSHQDLIFNINFALSGEHLVGDLAGDLVGIEFGADDEVPIG